MNATIDRDKARILRGLSLYRSRGERIEHLDGERYLVPGSSPGSRYHTHLNGGCTCPDFQMRRNTEDDGPCKHIYAVAIYRAKTIGRRERASVAS